MRNAMKIAKKDKRFGKTGYDETTLRIEHKKQDDPGWPHERPSDIIRRAKEAGLLSPGMENGGRGGQ